MELLKKNLANLLKVKTIVTLFVMVVFVVKALRNEFSDESVLALVVSVLSFYFGTQYEKTGGTKA